VVDLVEAEQPVCRVLDARHVLDVVVIADRARVVVGHLGVVVVRQCQIVVPGIGVPEGAVPGASDQAGGEQQEEWRGQVHLTSVPPRRRTTLVDPEPR